MAENRTRAPLSAPEYLLRVNYGSEPPGTKTPVHSHFGSEAFYIIAGKLGQRTLHGVASSRLATP